ncbi:MAG: hypothetical protein ABWZ82_05150 [Candidatus Limnocylindrales bacterium]
MAAGTKGADELETSPEPICTGTSELREPYGRIDGGTGVAPRSELRAC